ncbi:hypothetical protein FPV67DRAFT_246768 [Lyophyllum atratum]|nr:hypothetical protein FPV67DRAFT_246768 [Lyophyllum atratum]
MSTKSEGQLDPGAPPRRKSISGCKCLLFSAVAVIALGAAALFTIFTTTFSRTFFTPHTALYHNTTLEGVTNRATVVQPLVGREQTFDLAATVWLRTSNLGRHRDGEYVVDTDAKKEKIEEATEDQKEDDALVEEPLYSNIIFRGVRLTDKNLQTTINFTVPTALFRNVNLTNYDLRGSVMLIPTSPSLLNHVTNYSSYIPDAVEALPVRAWPFPLGSNDLGEKTLVDKALESFGASVPLVQFHGVQSRCTAGGGKTEVQDNSDDEEEEEDLEEEPETPVKRSKRPKNAPSIPPLEITDGKSVLKYHPYIVTRTQIRILDENRLFERKAYQKAHKKLGETACGQEFLVRPNRYFCKGTYRSNGNWETQLQLRVPNKSTGKVRTEWAYAPFIYLASDAIGQKDLLAIPVNRENCSENAKVSGPLSPDVPEQDVIDVTWKVSYTGRTPAKMTIADLMGGYKWYAFNDTEHAQASGHDNAEMANGLVEHRFSEGAHPRRRFFLALVSTLVFFVITCIDVRYWFTRKYTVSISIPGTALLAAFSIIDEVDGVIAKGIMEQFTLAGWVGAVLFATATSLVLPATQLKAIFRVDLGWWNGWIPVVHRTKATHSERASERLEAQTSWSTKSGLFLFVLGVYYFLTPHRYQVIAALIPDPKADQDVGVVPAYLLLTMQVVGKILQIILNWRSRSFAGSYRISALFMLFLSVLALADFVPALVGRFEPRRALSGHFLVESVLVVIYAWQCLVLPSAPQTLEEDHIE